MKTPIDLVRECPRLYQPRVNQAIHTHTRTLTLAQLHQSVPRAHQLLRFIYAGSQCGLQTSQHPHLFPQNRTNVLTTPQSSKILTTNTTYLCITETVPPPIDQYVRVWLPDPFP
jgi:hypothetical protein